MLSYPAVFNPAEEGGFVVTFPDFGYGGTQGNTNTEAVEMAEDLLTFLLGQVMKDRKPIPKPGKIRGKHVRAVPVPALIAAKVQLYTAMNEQGVRKAELARRMRQSKQQVERLLNLRHASRLDQLEAAFAALNKQLAIEIRDRAA